MTVHELALEKHEKCFFENWDRAFSELRAAVESDNKVWLVGPSAYLFSIGGVKFAVDLQVRREKDLEVLSSRLCGDLESLSFVLITHQHDDHFCVPLIKMAAELPLVWYLPHKMPERFLEAAGLSQERCVRLEAGESFDYGGVSVTAFDSPHIRPGADAVMPELGYLIRSKGGSVLIPADVRDYSYRGYPDFGEIDLCFSHLWAGDNAIDEEAYLPMLEQFVDFSLRFSAKRYFICHLYEIGRKEKYMWHSAHAELAMKMFKEKKPQCCLDVPEGGRSYELFL